VTNDETVGLKEYLSGFRSIHNEDVERFIKEKALDFSAQSVARTHLVLLEKGDFLGYFTLAHKILQVPAKLLSKNLEKKVSRFGRLDERSESYSLPLPLIAQLGKNYAAGLKETIDGSILLKLACDKVKRIQRDLGGKFTYVECEDKEPLISFYTRNEFVRIDGGDPLKLYDTSKPYLVQMIRLL